MKFREFGEKAHPTVILLHREGLSWRSLKPAVRCLERNYHVVAPVIDGHEEDGATTFVSIQDSAEKLIRYIDENCQGSVLAVGGLCLGAQIAVEVLSRRTDIAKYAVLESVSVCPAGGIPRLSASACGSLRRLIGKRCFAKIWAERLGVPGNLSGQYGENCARMSRKSLANVIRSGRNYTAPDGIKNTRAKVLIIVGTGELKRMDRSVRFLMNAIPGSQVCVSPGTRRGGFTLAHPMEYLALVRHFLQ